MAVLDLSAAPTIKRRTYTGDETAALLGVSRTAAYAAIARGDIAAIRLGRRLLVPRQAIDGLLAVAGVAGVG